MTTPELFQKLFDSLAAAQDQATSGFVLDRLGEIRLCAELLKKRMEQDEDA